MYKVAVVGDRDTVMVFKILGMEVYEASETRDVENIIEKLDSEGCAIVFITEKLMAKSSGVVEKYSARKTPAIIPIPDHTGPTGYGMDSIKKLVEKAVGADIL